MTGEKRKERRGREEEGTTTTIKSFCRGPGGGFLEKSPLDVDEGSLFFIENLNLYR